MKETSQNPSLIKVNLGKKIKIAGFVENFLGQKVWYDMIIRLDERYLLEDLKRFSNLMNAHYPTITVCYIEDIIK